MMSAVHDAADTLVPLPRPRVAPAELPTKESMGLSSPPQPIDLLVASMTQCDEVELPGSVLTTDATEHDGSSENAWLAQKSTSTRSRPTTPRANALPPHAAQARADSAVAAVAAMPVAAASKPSSLVSASSMTRTKLDEVRTLIDKAGIMVQASDGAEPLKWTDEQASLLLHSCSLLGPDSLSVLLAEMARRSVRPQCIAELCFLLDQARSERERVRAKGKGGAKSLEQGAERRTAHSDLDDPAAGGGAYHDDFVLIDADDEWRQLTAEQLASLGPESAQTLALMAQLDELDSDGALDRADVFRAHATGDVILPAGAFEAAVADRNRRLKLTGLQRAQVAAALFNSNILSSTGAGANDLSELALENLLPPSRGIGAATRLISAIGILGSTGVKAHSFEQLTALIKQHWAHAQEEKVLLTALSDASQSGTNGETQAGCSRACVIL